MSNLRNDLLALGEAELVALANRGLLKRAQKMLGKNEHQLSVLENGSVVVQVGEIETILEAGRSLVETSCSCGASGLCRHKILAILAYQESSLEVGLEAEDEEWSPADFDDSDLKGLLGRSAWRRALRLKSGGPRVKLVRGGKPVAYLPTCSVSFLVPRELTYARCDCSLKGPCEHIALAVWSFRQSGDLVSFDVREEKLDLDFKPTDIILEELLRLGVSAAEPSTIEKLRDQAIQYQKQKLVWISDLSSDLADSLEGYLARGAGFYSSHYCALLVEWWARTLAARKGSPSVLLGYGENAETSLEQTSLTCLGLRLDQDESQSRAEFFFAEPYTGVVTVLNRSWNGLVTGPDFAKKGVSPVGTVGRLATSQMITESAKRRANRTLIIGRSRVGKTSVFEDQGDWGSRFTEPLLVKDFEKLQRELTERPPAMFCARLRAENLRILQISGVEDLVYAPGSQTLYAKLIDSEGGHAIVTCHYRKAEPGALPDLVEKLRAAPKHLSGFVSLRNQGLEFEPLSIVLDKVYCPALAEPKEFREVPYVASEPHFDELSKAWELCARACYQGFKFLTPNWSEDCGDTAGRLRSQGYPILAEKILTLARETNRVNWHAAALRAHLLRA